MPSIDEELRTSGARWRAEQPEPIVDLGRATARGGPRRVLIAACVSLIVVGTVAALAVGTSGPRRVHVVGPSTPATSPAPKRPDVIALSAAIVQPDVLAVEGNRLWVTGYAPVRRGRQGPAVLQQVDSETGKTLGQVTLPDDGPFEIRMGVGVVWVAAQQAEESTELLKIDAATMRIVARLPGVKSSGFAVAHNAIWSTDGLGALRRIDPATLRVVATIPVHKFAIYAAGWVVAGPLGVFVGNGYDGTVQRIDEAMNTAGPGIHVASDSSEMVELAGSLWVERSDGSQVMQVRNGRLVRTVDLGERALGFATDGTALWLGTDSSHVLRVDPESGSVAKVALPAGTHATTVAADPATGAVWATSMLPTPRLLRVPAGP